MAGFTARKQALHDILAGCLVIRKCKSVAPVPSARSIRCFAQNAGALCRRGRRSAGLADNRCRRPPRSLTGNAGSPLVPPIRRWRFSPADFARHRVAHGVLQPIAGRARVCDPSRRRTPGSGCALVAYLIDSAIWAPRFCARRSNHGRDRGNPHSFGVLHPERTTERPILCFPQPCWE